MWRKGNPSALLVGTQTGAATVKALWSYLKKLKMDLSFDPVIPFQGIYPKEPKILIQKNISTPIYVLCSVIYNHRDVETAQVSTSRWVDKATMGHLHNGILLGHKKEENFTLCVSTDGPREHYAKWNKPVRERQALYDFIYMWSLMNKITNKQNKNRLIDTENRLITVRGEESCGAGWNTWRD